RSGRGCLSVWTRVSFALTHAIRWGDVPCPGSERPRPARQRQPPPGEGCIARAVPAPPVRAADQRTLALLELLRSELMAGEEFVELGTVAPREARGLTHVAAGDLQDLREVAARELIARLVEGGQPPGRAAEGLLHELDRDDRRLRQGDVLAHD